MNLAPAFTLRRANQIRAACASCTARRSPVPRGCPCRRPRSGHRSRICSCGSAALKNSVNALIDSLSTTGASEIKVHLIDFDSGSSAGGTFTLRSGGAVDTAGVAAAHAWVNSAGFAADTDFLYLSF